MEASGKALELERASEEIKDNAVEMRVEEAPNGPK